MRSSPSVPVLSSVSGRAAASSQRYCERIGLPTRVVSGRRTSSVPSRSAMPIEAPSGIVRAANSRLRPTRSRLRPTTPAIRPSRSLNGSVIGRKPCPAVSPGVKLPTWNPACGPSRGGGPPLPAGERLRLIAALAAGEIDGAQSRVLGEITAELGQQLSAGGSIAIPNGRRPSQRQQHRLRAGKQAVQLAGRELGETLGLGAHLRVAVAAESQLVVGLDRDRRQHRQRHQQV